MIIFYRAVWQERPYEVDFFEKSSEFGRRVVGKWSKKDEKGSKMDAVRRFWASFRPKSIAEGLGRSWKGLGRQKMT